MKQKDVEDLFDWVFELMMWEPNKKVPLVKIQPVDKVFEEGLFNAAALNPHIVIGDYVLYAEGK